MEIIFRTTVIFWTLCYVVGVSSTLTPLIMKDGQDIQCVCKNGTWISSSCDHVECSCDPPSGHLPQSRTWSSLETNCSSGSAADPVCGQVRILRMSGCVFNGTELVLDRFNVFPYLRELTVTGMRWSGGNGSLLLRDPDLMFDNVTLLNLSGNALGAVHSGVLSAFVRLEVLVLDGNNLTFLDGYGFSHGGKLNTISLCENPWSCENMTWFMKWMRAQSPEVRPRMPNANATWCHHSDGRGSGKTTFSNLIELCPVNCTCSLHLYQVSVNCSSQLLRSFPKVVPVNTSTVILDNNLIDSLDSLISGKNYANLRKIHLDNNSISSIDRLKEAVCFSELVSLNLTGNQLRTIKRDIIDSLISDSQTDVRLGNNPWSCDCDDISKLYDLLVMNPKKFKDIDDIRCADNGTQLAGEVISRLKKFQLCWKEAARIAKYHPSDIIDPIFVILIFAIIAKLTYDYFKFKYSGKLPFGPLNLCRRMTRDGKPEGSH